MDYALLTPIPVFDLNMNQLNDSWNRWNNDSSLSSVLRFGQYALSKHLPSGMSWAECFYADTGKAYAMLYHVAQQTEERRRQSVMYAPVDYLDI